MSFHIIVNATQHPSKVLAYFTIFLSFITVVVDSILLHTTPCLYPLLSLYLTIQPPQNALLSGFSSHTFSPLIRVLSLFHLLEKVTSWVKHHGNCYASPKICCLFSNCSYFKSHRIISRCLNLFCLHPDTDHIKDKVGLENTSKPAGGENRPTKQPPKGKTQVKKIEPTQTEERATLEHPDKEI